jgi:hypothetical protein
MNVDTDQFAAIKAEALEAAGLRRILVMNEIITRGVQGMAEERGFKRGWAAGRRAAGKHARPLGNGGGNLRLVAAGGEQ